LDYCKDNDLPFSDIKMIQRYELDHSEQLRFNSSIEIQFPKNFPQEHRDGLIKVANNCLIKKVMETGPTLTIKATETES